MGSTPQQAPLFAIRYVVPLKRTIKTFLAVFSSRKLGVAKNTTTAGAPFQAIRNSARALSLGIWP